MNIVISFASETFKRSQKILETEAYKFGADKVISYSAEDLDKKFIKDNYKILKIPRGAGLWLWKPYFILKTMKEFGDNHNILYCDSGAYPINDLSHLFNLLNNKDIVLFRLIDKINKDWTKGDCFKLMDCQETKYFETDQTLATFQLYKNTEQARKFVEEYLNFCCNYEVISDSQNLYYPNSDTFIEHRYDQSILANLSIKHNIERFRDPSQYGNKQFVENSSFPQIFNLHRNNF